MFVGCLFDFGNQHFFIQHTANIVADDAIPVNDNVGGIAVVVKVTVDFQSALYQMNN